MSKKKQTPILSDKIAELIAPRRLLDPEIDSEDETAARAIDYGIDENFDGNEPVSQLSDIRRKNVKLLHDVDAKYQGKVSSRKELEMDTSESEENEDFDGDDDDDDAASSANEAESTEKSIGEFSMMLTPRQKIKLAQNADENNDENSFESDELSEDEGDIKSFAMKLNQSKQKSETNGDAGVSDAESDTMNEPNSEKWDDDYEGEEEQSAEEEESMNGTDDEGEFDCIVFVFVFALF